MELLTTIIYTTHFSPKEMNTIVTDTIFKSFYSLQTPERVCSLKKVLSLYTSLSYFSFRLFRKHRRALKRSGRARERKNLLPLPLPLCTGGQQIPRCFYFLPRALDRL